MEYKTSDFESRENALLQRENELDERQIRLNEREAALRQRKEDISSTENLLSSRESDLDEREEALKTEQSDFAARRGELSTQQFDYADKIGAYNADLKSFNEDLQRFHAERTAWGEERRAFDEDRQNYYTEKALWQKEKEKYETEKARAEEENTQTMNAVREQAANLTRREAALKDKEYELESRETALNEARRQFNAARIAQEYAALTGNPSSYDSRRSGQAQNPPPAQPAQRPAPYEQDFANDYKNDINSSSSRSGYDFSALNERAQAVGIRLRTAGSAQKNGSYDYENAATAKTNVSENSGANGFFNKGKTLFKAAMVIFFIVIAESLSAFFLRDKLQVNGLYPFTAFAVGFLAFLICTIMYASGYKPRVRRTKKCPYIVTACVLFVIVTVLASMIAVYLKADLRSVRDLFTFVILPVLYLFNIVLFSIFYRLFSKTADAD